MKAFPVWPADGWNGLEKGKRVIGLCLEDYSEGLDFYETGNYYQIGIDCNKSLWQIACTREQHIRKRIELFENYRPSMGSVMLPNVTLEELAYIAEIDGKAFNEPETIHITPLKEPVVKKSIGWLNDEKEWVPEVGQECEYSYDFFFQDRCNGLCTVIAYYCGDVWIELSVDKTRHVVKADKIEFRPLKTEAEKERENLIKLARDTVIEGIYNTPITGLDIETESALEVLIDEGWRPSNEIASLIMKSCYKHGTGDYWREIAADVLEGMGQVESRKKLTGREND